MAKTGLDGFFETVPGKQYVLFDVDSVIDPIGDFTRIEDIDVIIRSLTRIFGIPQNTYYMDPDIGTVLHKFLFEPADLVTKTSIDQEIGRVVSRYERRAKITHEVLFFKNKKGFRVNFYVEYQGRKKNVSVIIDEELLKTIPEG